MACRQYSRKGSLPNYDNLIISVHDDRDFPFHQTDFVEYEVNHIYKTHLRLVLDVMVGIFSQLSLYTVFRILDVLRRA